MVCTRIYLLTIVLAILSATRVEGGAKLVRKQRNVPGSYLVAIKSGATDDQLDGFVKSLRNLTHPDNPYQISRVRGLRAVTKGITAELNEDALELVRENPLVDFVEEDHFVEGTAAPPWHLDKLDQTRVQPDGSFLPGGTGEGVHIYVLDSGINMAHTEFENRAFPGIDLVDEYSNSQNNGRDCNGHGTHVASLAAGKTVGVAKKATVYSVRVLDCQKMGRLSYVLKGLDYVTDIKQKNRNQRIIVVMSLVGTRSFLLNLVVDQAKDQGLVVVTAAGNDRKDACNYSPGSSVSSINVGATDYLNSLYQFGPYGTNYGRCVDIFAPGFNINGAYFRQTLSFKMLSGTSMACPLVAGAAAILLEKFPTFSPSMVKDALILMSTKEVLKFNRFRSPMHGFTPNRLLHINDIALDEVRRTLLPTFPPVVIEEFEKVGTTEATEIDHFSLEEKDFARVTDIAKQTTHPTVATTESGPPSAIPTTLPNNQKTIQILVKVKSIQAAVRGMKKRNYYLKYLNYITSTKKTYFSMIFEHNSNAQNYTVYGSLRLKAARRVMKMANSKGQEIYLLVPYVRNNQRFYCVGLKKNISDGFKLKYFINMEPEEADRLYKTFTKRNYQLLSERLITIGNRVYVTLGYVKSTSKLVSVKRYRDLSYNSLMQRISEDEELGYKLKDVSTYYKEGKTYYSLLLTFDNKVFSGTYKRVLRSRRRIKETLSTFNNQGLYPSVIAPIKLVNRQPYFLISLTKNT